MTTENKEMIAATLAWCNQRRKEKGLEPLEDLPRGKRNNGLSCPCGAACGLFVGNTRYYPVECADKYGHLLDWVDFYSSSIGEVPDPVRKFISRFDMGGFPQYLEEE